MSIPQAGDTLVGAALKVLCVGDPWQKAEYTHKAVELWQSGGISQITAGPHESRKVPDRPHRADDKVKLVQPRDMPKLGKGGTLTSRQALLHSLAHIENWAIDLSWDIIARFGSDPSYELPREFFDDFVKVAADECRHFCSLAERLEALQSHYGALPAHDGLWESASATAHSLPARLAVEHCVHEARGLDVLPNTVHKFRSNGDEETAALLWDVIYAEEISHCAAGVKWLKHLHSVARRQQHQQQEAPAAAPSADAKMQPQENCSRCSTVEETPEANLVDSTAAAGPAAAWLRDAQQFTTVEAWFHELIRRHFKGNLKPPFNDAARAKAGFGPDWYLPLAQVQQAAAAANTAAVVSEDTPVAAAVADSTDKIEQLGVTHP